MTAIVTVNLTKRYGTSRGCRDINLTVSPGQVFGLLGPNGAGKSTFVKMIVGLLHPTSGTAWVMGYPVGSVAARKLLGYLPELFRYPDWLTAEEVLRFHAGLGGLPVRTAAARIEQVLRDTGLAGYGDRKVKAFSKGMQQRLGLAGALLFDPPLLILDEPASALDPVGRHEIRELLLRLKNQGKTVFLNTHLLEDVEALCDEVAFLYEGELLASGRLDELLRRGSVWEFSVGGWLPESRGLLQAAALAGVSLQVLEADTDGRAVLRADAIHEEQAAWINTQLVAEGLTLYESGRRESHLEQWFLSMAGSVKGAGA